MKLNIKKVCILSNGCIRRSFDLSRFKKYFKSNSYQVVKNPKKADFIIFISCSVKKNKEEESFKLINKFYKHKGEVIVGGCLPEIVPVKFKQKFKGKFFSSKNINKIDEFFPDFKIKLTDIENDPVFAVSSPMKDAFKIRLKKQYTFFKKYLRRCYHPIKYFVKKEPPFEEQKQFLHAYINIGYGCQGNCSYCSVHKAMEPFRSRPLDECCQEYEKFIQEGYRSFTIMSPDTGAYGLDTNSSLPELLDKLSDINNGLDVKWNIIDLRPIFIIKYKTYFLEKIKDGKISSLLIPIQSGSNRVLKLMNRYMRCEDLLEALLEFKKINPHLALRTHIIIGFPSETEDDFKATLDFIKKANFNHVDVLLYYNAEGTVASEMSDKVDEKIARSRVKCAIDFLNAEKIGWDCDDI